MSGLTAAGSTRAWRKLRAWVITRDQGRCWLCGQPGADTVDHIVPRAHGGRDVSTNLAAAHKRCNCGKGDRAPVAPAPSRSW